MARRPPPSVYKQADDAARIKALEQFMEGKGLSRHSTPTEITVRHHVHLQCAVCVHVHLRLTGFNYCQIAPRSHLCCHSCFRL